MRTLMISLRKKRLTPRGDEAGMAMIMVILVCAVLMLVPIALADAVTGQLPLARQDQNYASALAAAEAGVQDYVNRLNADSNYWTTSDPGDLALSRWVPVSSIRPAGLVEGYCYTVDMDGYGNNGNAYTTDLSISETEGIVKLTIYGYAAAGGALPTARTGTNPCVGGHVPSSGAERIIGVELREDGFVDYLELTDLQLVDQDWYNQQQGGNITDCYNNLPQNAAYYYAEKDSSQYGHVATDCGPLQNYWVTGNELTGNVRSNDDYYLCGTPQFNGAVTSDDPATSGTYWVDPVQGYCGSDSPVFQDGKIVEDPDPIIFPKTDTSELSEGQSSSGCYYVGPTDIIFNKPNATTALALQYPNTATITVTSPMTNSADSPNFSSCGGGSTPTSVPLPSDGVIYVDNGSASTDSLNCASYFGSELNWALPDNPGNPWADLPAGDVCDSTHSPGDVFTQGTVSSAVTLVAADNVFITGDLTYQSDAAGSQDILGVVADKYIEIEHATQNGSNVYGTEPFYQNGSIDVTVDSPADWGTSSCNNDTSHPDCDVRVDAALLALGDSLGVENYAQGVPWGTLTIDGSIAEEYMDIEGVFEGGCNYTTQIDYQGDMGNAELCNGMNSVYQYDNRLRYTTPPHFITPNNAEWKELSFEECLSGGPNQGCQS